MKFSQLKLTTPYLKLDPIFYDRVKPTPLKQPFLIAVSQDAAALLDVDEALTQDEKLLSIINGETFLEGSDPFALCYAGHQFGYFVPRLGDGRAINLGYVNGYHLQLKGAGQTLYSRQGDGRAVLRSSIREFLVSEAMFGLGIETTRALALIGSDEDVARERWEKGAMVLRLSPSWVRFGTFEYFRATHKFDLIEALADYVIAESFPHLKEENDRYLLMFKEIVQKTALLVAKWQSVGFNHGVMNTDNMSIASLTIDYGPYAFLDDFEAHYVCNHTDHEGRYSFVNQPPIALWNLEQLSRALDPIIAQERMDQVLKSFPKFYEDAYASIMYEKLGFTKSEEDDLSLLRWLLGVLESGSVDYTRFFRLLSHYDGDKTKLLELLSITTPLSEWLDAYDARLLKEELSVEERPLKMRAVNPKYILKNHILQEAIEKAEMGDFTGVNDLLTIALKPFDEHPEFEHLSESTPEKHKNIKLSCSS